MMHDDEPLESALGWVADHARRYIETDGEDGHMWRGCPTLVLVTRGRRSGKLRRQMLIYGRDGDNYLIVASKGGADDHPLWYLNLTANPEVDVQVMADRFRARARTATPEEKPRLWSIMTGIYPPYNDYQAKTSRDIPIVILERIS